MVACNTTSGLLNAWCIHGQIHCHTYAYSNPSPLNPSMHVPHMMCMCM
jgi:hypothetical protein